MLKKLTQQVKEYTKASLLTPLFTALEAVVDTMVPLAMGRMVDMGINQKNMNAVFLYGFTMVLLAGLGLLFGILAGKYAAYASSGFAANVRDAMYTNIQTFSFANIDKFSTAGLVTRLTTDVTNLQNAYQMIIRIAVRAPMMLLFSLIMAILISFDLSRVFLVAILFLLIALSFIISHATPLFRSVFKKYDDLNASVQENVSAIRVVKAFVREDYEKKKFGKAAENLYHMFVKAETLVVNNQPIMMLAIFGSMLGLSWLGAHYIVLGTLTEGELTMMFSYVMGILMSLMMLSMIFVMVTMSSASAQRIVEVLEEESSITSPAGGITEVKDGSISFKNVDFAYSTGTGEPVLSDINLDIKSGETIGIIGGTGSSKTSLVNLISRLYDVTGGSVLVGGQDVRSYDLEALRDQVSVVLQKNELFSGSILDNLRWGKPDATKEECIEACKLACADEFIQTFPDGYETHIEQGATNVSGGQKQRLCIARALLKHPKILILDDSTSAVDTATDARIQEAFRSYIPDTTKLIIAQRISSVQNADRILVLDNGHVSGFDTHEALLSNNEIYREVYESQTQGGGDFDQKGGM
ncbi:MAG: ABC transporter ATP-binding protein [Lachnospiraceae bacterium]|jgi:ATP-binding cassette subfamily B protein|nr:ABC transporter ATP-binding protein [Lachnospiraceae bacterium]